MLEEIDTTGIFKAKYPDLSGKNWLQSVDPEDRKVFSHLGMVASDYGTQGGIARAKTARRDKNRRFTPNKTTKEILNQYEKDTSHVVKGKTNYPFINKKH